MSSHSDILQHLGCLDELTQVIYQGFYRFVVLSNVDDQHWTVHLALLGPEGRWWRGVWDSVEMLKSKPSSKLLDTFAERMAGSFTKGELCIENWSTDKGAKLKLTVGPTSQVPQHINLTELAAQEAAAHATKVIFDIALQSQSRGNRLNMPANPPRPPSPPPLAQSSVPSRAAPSTKKQEDEIKALKAELANEKKRHKSPPDPTSKPVAPRPPKGASLANPNKKARKYQALEFESDEE